MRGPYAQGNEPGTERQTACVFSLIENERKFMSSSEEERRGEDIWRGRLAIGTMLQLGRSSVLWQHS